MGAVRPALLSTYVRVGLGLAVLLAPACAEELPGFAPPEDQLHYPVSLTFAGEHLLVVSSNYDQRYNAGSLMALSLDGLSALVPDGVAEPFVARELPGASRSRVKVSSFGGQVVAVPRAEETEVYLASRRGNRVTRVRYAGGALDCGNGAVEARVLGTDCTPARTLATVADGELVSEDPFSIGFLPGVSSRGLVLAGALRPLEVVEGGSAVPVGVVSAIDPAKVDANLVAEQAGQALSRPMENVAMVGLVGTFSLVAVPGTTDVLATGTDGSFSDIARVSRYTVSATAGVALRRLHTVDLGTLMGADSTRGLTLSEDGARAYVSARLVQPAGSVTLFNSAVVVLSPADGRMLGHLEVGEELGVPALLERPGAAPSRLLYVPDLRSDRIYVLDVSQDAPLLVHVIEPKASPSAASRLIAAPAQLAIAPAALRARLGGRTLAFVANFGNSTLGVLDLSDPDPRNHRVAARLGRALSDDGVDEVE